MSRSSITTRLAKPEDLEPLNRLIAASYATLDDGSYAPEIIAKAMPAISRANPVLLASGTYHVAEIDGVAAGCGGWTREKPGSGARVDGIAHIRHFATDPAFARRGVARALLGLCMAEAYAAGVTLMKAQSTLPAEPFYTSAGFRRVRLIEVETIEGVFLPAIEMERPLR